MPTEIHLATGIPNNPKTRKLVRLLGDHGFACLVRLWCFAGEFKQKGVLLNMDVADIEEQVLWKGDPGDFVATLEDENWLEKDPSSGEYSIHQWREHQPWIYYAEERSMVARDNAVKGWVTRRGGEKYIDPERGKGKKKKETALEDVIPIREIVEYLNQKADKAFSHTSKSTKRFIAARWKDGFSLEDFKKVIDNQVAKWKGDPTYDAYLRPETLFNETKFQGYLNGPSPGDGRLAISAPEAMDTAGRRIEELPE